MIQNILLHTAISWNCVNESQINFSRVITLKLLLLSLSHSLNRNFNPIINFNLLQLAAVFPIVFTSVFIVAFVFVEFYMIYSANLSETRMHVKLFYFTMKNAMKLRATFLCLGEFSARTNKTQPTSTRRHPEKKIQPNC